VAIDFGVVFFVSGPILAFGPDAGLPPWAANAVACCLAWAYLAGLKATGLATLGYRLANVELVDLQGRRVGLWRCTHRFLVLFAAPFNLLDLTWLTHDPNRQTLRDKVAGTYVVRRGARPLGSGSLTYPTYFIGGLSFVFTEVMRDDDQGGPGGRLGEPSHG